MPSSHSTWDRSPESSSRRKDDRGDRHRGHRRERERSRSRSPKRERKRKDRERSDSEGPLCDLTELGVKEISEDDYFLKSSEFKYWLKEERGKYLDEMSSEAAHKYFRKFVRRWNDGALPEKCYKSQSATALPSSSNTAYKWSFTGNRSRVDSAQLSQARAEVDRLTHSNTIGPLPPSSSSSTPPLSNRQLGPSLPPALSTSDRQLALEQSLLHSKLLRKKDKEKEYERLDDIVPRERGGREGKIDEKRAVNAANREVREGKGEGLAVEVDEGTLMGEGGGFKAALAARNRAQAKRDERKAIQTADKRAFDEERLSERRAKETSTMDMFKAMAKERFG